jgi:tetratricopeptide (TPR) repeat protein
MVLSTLVLAVMGCSERSEPGSLAGQHVASQHVASEPSPRAAGAATSASAAAAQQSTVAGVQPVRRNGLSWYEDAPDAAFAAARAAGKRVLVDLWAPWCHTCLSMQSLVMTAENLPDQADRFVWLALDTERESNARWLERLPVSVWPTFYVVDAAEPERVDIQGRWLGAASPAQFRRFLSESDRAAKPEPGASRAPGPLLALSGADNLAAQGRHAEAARAYAAVLESAPADWPRRPETWVAQMTALWKAKDFGGCLSVANAGLSQTGVAASAIDFAYYALECADQVKPVSADVTTLRRAIVVRLEPLCANGSSELSPDDRADACDKLAQARSALGDADGARSATLARLGVLESAASGKASESALTYDWARTDALLQLGRAEEALAVATERERQLPQNYNPPHYRAKAFKALGRWPEGLEAIERALSLAYGPRKIGLLTLKADLLFGGGRATDGVRTLQEQLAAYRALPAGQRQASAEARVELRLREASAARAPAR